jgi:LysR family glycine cleavage system transcriptional activator
MVEGDLAAGTLRRLFDVQVEGHESYWFVTRPQATLTPNVQAFRTWLFSEAGTNAR